MAVLHRVLQGSISVFEKRYTADYLIHVVL